MEYIKLTQTQALSSTGSVVGESPNGLASEPTTIDERVIADEVLGVCWGHRKGVERIVKGKKKVLGTSYSTVASGLTQSQVTNDRRRLVERLDAQQHNLEAQHREINDFNTFII